MAKQLYFSIDTETGGLHPSVNKLLQVGIYAIELDTESNSITKHFMFEWNVKPSSTPTRTAEPDAMAVNGLSLEYLEDTGIDLTELSRRIVDSMNEVIAGCPDVKKSQIFLLGQNLAFDMRFLNHMLCKFAVDYLATFRQFELMCFTTAYFVFKGVQPDSISLGKITNELAIENEHAHTAYSDAKATCLAMVEIRKRLANKEH